MRRHRRRRRPPAGRAAPRASPGFACGIVHGAQLLGALLLHPGVKSDPGCQLPPRRRHGWPVDVAKLRRPPGPPAAVSLGQRAVRRPVGQPVALGRPSSGLGRPSARQSISSEHVWLPTPGRGRFARCWARPVSHRSPRGCPGRRGCRRRGPRRAAQAGWRTDGSTGCRGGLDRVGRAGRMQRVEQHRAGAVLGGGPVDELAQIAEIADPPRPRRAQRVQLEHPAPCGGSLRHPRGSRDQGGLLPSLRCSRYQPVPIRQGVRHAPRSRCRPRSPASLRPASAVRPRARQRSAAGHPRTGARPACPTRGSAPQGCRLRRRATRAPERRRRRRPRPAHVARCGRRWPRRAPPPIAADLRVPA